MLPPTVESARETIARPMPLLTGFVSAAASVLNGKKIAL
jgi:hypothetical protein